MGILRSDRVSGLGGANAIVGSTRFVGSGGNGDAKTVTYFKDSSLSPGTSDFCAEGWVYFNFVDNTNNTQLFANLGGNFGVANDTSWAVIRIGANNQFYGWTGSAWAAFGAGAPTVNTWHYIQLVRASNVQTLYMDGTALASTVTNSNDLTNDEVCLGGRDDGSEVLDGYISNFRLTIGSSASALAGIVPSAASRVLSTDTKLLCCNDPGNVNNEDAQGIPTSTTPDNDVQMMQGFASRFVPDKGEDYGTTFEDNTKFDTLSYMVPPGGTTTERSRGRGILFGGGSPGRTDRIDYIEIPSGGNSIDFGNLVCGSVWGSGAGASSTRGVFWGGENQYTKLDYVTIATTGNATSFGTSSNQSNGGTCMSSETRAVFVLTGGNIMEYVTIATTGNTTDFGDQNAGVLNLASGLASPTRGIVSGGYGPSPYPQSNTIEYITIATTGNASDFGDLTFGHSGHFGVSNTTRGVFAKGYTFPSPATVAYNTIEYITIASTGNATDFGDATNSISQGYSHASHIRGVFSGGTTPADVNTIDYITIATTGNAADFGDTHSATRGGSGTSDCHGGIA